MTNLFDRVKELVTNAIDNGYEPLAHSARELAEDIMNMTDDFIEDGIDAVTDATQQVKDYFDGGQKDE